MKTVARSSILLMCLRILGKIGSVTTGPARPKGSRIVTLRHQQGEEAVEMTTRTVYSLIPVKTKALFL